VVIAQHQAKLTDIHSLIEQIQSYPVTIKRLLETARQNRVSKEVISFYKSFPESAVFTDKEDILARTEAIEIMESQVSPTEDEVHGAED